MKFNNLFQNKQPEYLLTLEQQRKLERQQDMAIGFYIGEFTIIGIIFILYSIYKFL